MRTFIVIQILLVYSSGLVTLFVLYRLLNNFMRTRFGIEEANMAYAVFQSGMILSGSVTLSSVLDAAVNAVRFLNPDDLQVQGLMLSLVYVVVFLLIGTAFTLLIIFSGVFAFFQMTKVNEWEQIKADNVPTAVISAALILGLSLIIDEYVGVLCEALIPYPSVMQIR
jgi:uncharacterized membrane protein YjfL (UPF0719 family)